MDTIRIGVLTPSSNTALEPLTSQILADVPGATAHFSRFVVTRISEDAESQAQFETENLLQAARLLADAKVDSIIWSGTSASWLGFDNDIKLCEAITNATGAPAGSSVLAVNRLFDLAGVKRFSLVTPYINSIQQQIIANYQAAGYECASERHLSEQDNYSFALFEESQIEQLVTECATGKPDAVVVMCTNMRGTRIAQPVETDTGVLVIDSISAAVWDGLRLAKSDPAQVQGWGRLFGL